MVLNTSYQVQLHFNTAILLALLLVVRQHVVLVFDETKNSNGRSNFSQFILYYTTMPHREQVSTGTAKKTAVNTIR